MMGRDRDLVEDNYDALYLQPVARRVRHHSKPVRGGRVLGLHYGAFGLGCSYQLKMLALSQGTRRYSLDLGPPCP